MIDTAPWYGHGSSETVLGKALADVPRSAYYIHSKCGRYEKEAGKMFDFTFEKTTESVLLSISRMQCGHIDLMQVHDPEFADSLDLVLNETLPALDALRKSGLVRAIGVTGYPLAVQREIIERSSVRIDAALTYGHACLHDFSLFAGTDGGKGSSFFDFCKGRQIAVMNAAPLAMGLLAGGGNEVASWHPAGEELKSVCRRAARVCEEKGVDLAKIAIAHSLRSAAERGVATTFLGMKDEKEVDFALEVMREGGKLVGVEQEVLEELLSEEIFGCWRGEQGWDGMQEVEKYRKERRGEGGAV